MEIQAAVLAVHQIGKLRVEELPEGYRVIAPRAFSFGIVITFAWWAGVAVFFMGNTWAQRKENAAFFVICGVAVTLMRLSVRNVITVTGTEIEVLHKNFGLTWWKNSYKISNRCELRWVAKHRKSPSALELDCNGKRASFAYEITEAEATELLRLINSRFPQLKSI